MLAFTPLATPMLDSLVLASSSEANARCGLPPLLPCLNSFAPSVDALRRSLVSVTVVTQLVTHPVKGCSSGGHGLNITRHGSAWRCLICEAAYRTSCTAARHGSCRLAPSSGPLGWQSRPNDPTFRCCRLMR